VKHRHITGIVIRNYPIFNHDKMVELYTPSHGKIKLLAKYANTKKFRFGGSLDSTNVVKCQVYSGKTFQLLTQCDLIKSYPIFRQNYDIYCFGMYCLDSIKKGTVFDHENRELYALLENIFDEVQKGHDIQELKQVFHEQFLRIEGVFGNDLEKDMTDMEFKAALF